MIYIWRLLSATKQAQVILGNHGVTNDAVVAYVASMIDGTNADAGKVALPLGTVARVVANFFSSWTSTPSNPYNDVFMAGSTALKTASTAAESAILNPVAPTPVTPTYALSGPASVDEGKSAIVTLTTKGVASGDVVNYLISGVDAADVNSLVGSAVVGSDGKAYIQVTTTADQTTEGEETMTVTAGGATASVKINDVSLDTGKSLALTTGLDTTIKGGSANDTISAIATDASTATLTAGDSLDGGAGTDTLVIAVSGAATANPQFSATGIEAVSITNNSTAAYTLDTQFMTGLKSVAVTAGASNLTVDKAGIVDVSVTGSNKDLTITALSSAVSGKTDAATLTLAGAASSASMTVNYAGIETLNVVSTAANGSGASGNDFRVTVTDSSLMTANISGSATARLTLATAGATGVADVGVVDASTATAGMDLSVTAGTSGLLSIKGGSGDDRITVGAVTKAMTVAGGDGTDTIVVSAAAKATTGTQPGANVSGVEVLEIAAGGSASIAAFPAASFSSVTVKGTATLSDVGTAALTVNATPATAGGTITTTRATDGTADTATVNLSPTTSGTFDGVGVANEETVTISSGGSGANTITTLTGTAMKSLTVTGTRGLTVTTLSGGTALATVDASGNTGTVFSLDASGSAVAMTVKGSGGNPTSATTTLNTITTGTGNDNVTGSAWIDVITTGAGADTISAGAGNDTITSGAGNDVVDAGDGDNTITDASGNDSITSGSGNDVISAGSGVDTINAGAGDDQIAVSTLSDSSVIVGDTGTDRVAAATGTITSTSATTVNGAFIAVAADASPTLTTVEQLYISAQASGSGVTTPMNTNLGKAASLTTLWLEAQVATAATDHVKVIDFAGSTINLYGATDSAVESAYLTLDGVGQSFTVNLHDYDSPAAGGGAPTAVLNLTGASTVTLSGRSTSQFAGSADQANSLVSVNASGVDGLVVSTTGSAATQASYNSGTAALFTGDINATSASTFRITGGSFDRVAVGTVTATGGNLQTLEVAAGANGGVALTRVNGTGAALATVTITAGENAVISSTGAAAANAPVDLDFTSAAVLTATTNAGSTMVVDLTDEAVTAGTFAVGTASTMYLGDGINTVLGKAGSASSFTFTGGGFLAADNSLTDTTNTLSLAGTSVTFNVGGLTSATPNAYNVTATNVSTAATITTLAGADVILGGSGNDVINAGAGADSISGMAGNDNITAGTGADTVMGGAGNDSITLTENASTSAADVVQVSAVVGTSSDSARLAVTGNDNDTGQDTLTGFDLAVDTIRITATNVNNFTHGSTDVVAGTATGGIDTGAQGSFTTSTVIWNLDKTATVLGADAGDVVISFSGSTSAGASATFAASSVLARSQYVLTASTTAATIGGGDLADSITGGAGADSLSGGLGADTLTGGLGQDTITSGGGADRIVIASGDAQATVGGTGNSGTIVGFDVITDLTTGTTAANKDLIDFQVAPVIAGDVTDSNGTDSTLTVGGSDVVITHSVASGIATFKKTGAVALTISSDSVLAAVVQYLSGVDIGNAGASVAFTATYTSATRGATAHTYIYQQKTANAGGTDGFELVDVVNVTLTGIETSATTTDLVGFVG